MLASGIYQETLKRLWFLDFSKKSLLEWCDIQGWHQRGEKGGYSR